MVICKVVAYEKLTVYIFHYYFPLVHIHHPLAPHAGPPSVIPFA